MKNITSALILLFTVSIMPSTSYGTQASGSANIAKGVSFVTAGASSAYASSNFARCNSHNWYPCIQGAMGIAQMIQSLKGASNSGAAAGNLFNGEYGDLSFDSEAAGFCFNSGCEPDAIDTALSGFENAFSTGKGFDEASEALKNKGLSQLKAIEKLGFKVDLDAGTITNPNGKTSKFSDIKTNIPSSLSKALSKKVAGVQAVLGAKTTGGRGVASAGGSVTYKDEYIDGGLGKINFKSGKHKKKKKSAFLAGLSDKDAGKGGVGFAGDDIFGMIQRRYGKKMKAKEFIGR